MLSQATEGHNREVTVDIDNRLDLLGGFTDIVHERSGAVLALGACVGGSRLRVQASRAVARGQSALPTVNGEPTDGVLLGVVRRWLENAGLRADLTCLEITNHLPPGGGLGASSQLSFGLIAALAKTAGLDIPRPELARQAFVTENEFDSCGWQDFAPGVNGGVLFTTASPADSPCDLMPIYEAVPVRSAVLDELHARSVLAFTGASHFSGDNLTFVQRRIRNHDATALEAWRCLEQLARKGRALLMNNTLPAAAVVSGLSEFLAENWHCEIALTDGAVQYAPLSDIERQLALLGHGKLTGAGAGGHYYYIANSLAAKAEALQLLRDAGFVPIPWSIASRPARIHIR